MVGIATAVETRYVKTAWLKFAFEYAGCFPSAEVGMALLAIGEVDGGYGELLGALLKGRCGRVKGALLTGRFISSNSMQGSC
ncbi:hypothetical protein CBL13_03438 [Pseudomonas putida]|nr:hypothetical protein CBL13_03438 [Pseudomonas putida]